MPRLLFVIALMALCAPAIPAAEIYPRDTPNGGQVVIEGRITEGDFERFLNTVLEQGIYSSTVHLASNGGNVGEALKIGRFIRLNSMATETGARHQGQNICPNGIKPQNCNCASACVLIFLGGIHRSGNILGVHRPYLEHTVLKSLSLLESEVAGKLLEKETDKYFIDMGAPTSLKEILNANTSENIQMLDDAYINQNIAGYIKEVEEWLLAKCGSTKKLHSDNASSLREAMNNLECREKVLMDERRNSFAEKLTTTMSLVARSDKIPKGSILQFLYVHRGGLGEMIGKPLSEVIRMFALYGMGYQKDFTGGTPEQTAFRVGDTFDIRVDAQNFVREVSFSLDEHPDQRGYRGLFHVTPPMGGKSALTDLAGLYGRPLWAGCMNVGGCYAWFGTPQYDVEFRYDRDKKTITSVSFDPPGYFRHILENVPPDPVEPSKPQPRQ
jgi:hypothetical protein